MKLEQVLNQISVFVIYLDKDGLIVKTIGEPSVVGFNIINENTLLDNVLPEYLNLKKIIETVKSTGNVNKSVINYLSEKNKLYKISLIVNLEEEDLILLTFRLVCPLSGVEENCSLEDLKRRLFLSEERYNSFFENDPVMHISVNPKTGLIIDCNSLTIQKMGLDSKLDLIGLPVYKIYAVEDKERSLSLIEKFNNQGFLKGEEIDIKTKSGSPISILLYATSFCDENGEVLYSKSTLIDVTYLKNAKKEIQRKNVSLEVLNNKLEQFVSTCSHDLQEPLATIKFAASILKKMHSANLNEQGNKYVEYIDNATDRLSDQIKSLLEHSRIGNNASKTLVNVNRLLNTVIEDLGKSISETKTKIICNNELPTLKVFETEFRLLFQNLISNSIKYTEENVEPYIVIEIEDQDDFIKFSIEDNGIGISEMDKEEVFKIFNKVNNNNPKKGSGVGLAHCRKIVQMHSGNISVESTLGKGSKFSFTILK